MTAAAKEKKFLFSYDFRGEQYSLEVPAETPAEAQFRVSQMAKASFDGEVAVRVAVPTGRLSAILARWGL